MSLNRLFLILFICGAWLSASSQDLNFNQWIRKVPPTAKFTDPGYQVWCASMIKGADSRYYLFYSRWPDSLKHTNWVTDSEVALAVAKNPLGPYKFLKVVLPKRDKKYWDADVTHNPTVHKFGNKYYLYYMGNYGNGDFWDNRNHQRNGVATATSILNKWKRSDKPLIDISPGYDSLMVANPAVTKTITGKYAMIYKSVGHGPAPFWGKVNHRVAFSTNPDHGFIKLPNPVFTKDSVKFATEDPFSWVQEGKYWALVKDFKGSFTDQGLSIALFESNDAINRKPAKHVLASSLEIPWIHKTEKAKKLERPQLYFENGVPSVFFAAVMDNNDNSFIVAIPLQVKATVSGKDK